ncbi:hypothetical protein FB45DRAFT_1069706 [Roridomyces roridus]|uniref:F-box domain-containing protein n=1 Tax=Roridomyces roridus TaxID=1738132 RepID=A0AAD7AZG5_9AGAR|nr:hypothetical protein FB45DRAFT_1069706 [Roridomyces roridus]
MNAFRCAQCGSVRATADFSTAASPGTRLYQLLNSNDAPTEIDRVAAKSTISALDSRLALLNDEITRLEALKAERTSLAALRVQSQAVLSPIRSLPPEILSEIFFWTIPLADVLVQHRQLDLASWSVTQISARWREIAISTPSLWSQVVLSYSRGVVWPIEAVETQMRRARSLRIYFVPSRTVDAAPQLEMFQLLAAQSSRWEELVLGVTRPLIPAIAAIRDRVPLLSRLWLQWDDDPADIDMDSVSVSCFSNAPSLRQVCVAEELASPSVSLPVHQLTHYNLTGSIEMHMRILPLATHLVKAHIICNTAVHDVPRLTLPSLRQAFISPVEFLDYITVPGLEELGVWLPGRHEVDSPVPPQDLASRIIPLVARSSCVLRRLTLEGAPRSAETTTILQKIPTINHLVLVCSDPGANEETNQLLSALTAVTDNSTTKTVAPHLNAIFFTHARNEYVSEYADMLQSRYTAPECALQQAALVVQFESDVLEPLPEALDKLESLRSQGLDALVVSGPRAVPMVAEWTGQLPFE